MHISETVLRRSQILVICSAPSVRRKLNSYRFLPLLHIYADSCISYLMSSHCFYFDSTTSFFQQTLFSKFAEHSELHTNPSCAPVSTCAAYLEKLHHIYGPVVRIWVSTSSLLVSVKDSDLSKLVLMSARDRPPSTLKVPLPATNSMVFASEREVR